MERTTSRTSALLQPPQAKQEVPLRESSNELLRAYTSQSFDDHANYLPPEPTDPRIKSQETDLEKGESNQKSFEDDSEKEEAHRELDEEVEKQLERNPPPDGSGNEPPDLKLGEPKDPYLVDWEGPGDPENPKNWGMRRKWSALFVVSSFTFISPVSSSMVAPALTKMSADLGIKSEFEAAMVLSIFVLAYAVGPLFLGYA
jgi:hypothetical protein